LHIRNSASVVQAAMAYDASAWVCCGHQKAAATSVLELLMLAAQHGAELTLKATGPDADQLLDALVELFSPDYS
jgi:phosphocarrier protein